jgi:ferredoxin-NADP reductase
MTEPGPAPSGGRRTAIVRSVQHPTGHAVVLRLEVADRVEHLPGQHYVIRLVAEDGYVAQRSYSIVSDPADPLIELYIERLEDGEVSTFLSDGLQVGDEIQVQGPIGGWFVWRGDAPLVGIAGGSGVAPFISMIRTALRLDRSADISLVVSARTLADLPYADELAAARARLVLTREATLDGRAPGRFGPADAAGLVREGADYLICGSAGFAETATDVLRVIGVDVQAIRVERFGPTS